MKSMYGSFLWWQFAVWEAVGFHQEFFISLVSIHHFLKIDICVACEANGFVSPYQSIYMEPIPFTKQSSNSCIWNLDTTRKYDSGWKYDLGRKSCWKKTQAVQDWCFLPDRPKLRTSAFRRWNSCLSEMFFFTQFFSLHLSYTRTSPLSRKHSRGHKNLPIPPPRQRRLCPCAPPIPEDGCAKSRDAQLT